MKKLRDLYSDKTPPHAWSNAVQNYGAECKSSGVKGATRVHPDMGTFLTKHMTSTRSVGEVKFERMHYEEWIHFRTETKRFPWAEADAMWKGHFSKASPSDTRKDDPANGPYEPTSIPMPCSDSVAAPECRGGAERVQHGHQNATDDEGGRHQRSHCQDKGGAHRLYERDIR